MKKFMLLMAVSSTVFANEGNLRMPLVFESAAVLPPKIRNIRFMNARIDGINKFDNGGNVVAVGNSLNKTITFADSIKGKDNIYDRASLRGILKDSNIDPDSNIGDTTGMVNIAVNARVPVVAYGLNKKTTVAVAIPYVVSNISVATGYVADQDKNLENMVQNVLQDKRRTQHKSFKVQADTLNAIRKKLADNNYKQLSESEGEQSRLGDIRLVVKHQLDKQDNSATALKLELVAPTGQTLDPDKAVDMASGDGQWDIGVGMVSEYRLNSNVSFAGYAGYLFQLEKTAEKRIPTESDSKITPDSDNNTLVDLGDQINLQASVRLDFWNGFTFLNGYSYQHKGEDRYSGNLYASSRYDYLERDTEQTMHAYISGLGFSTIPLFKQKKFKVPLQANLFYTSVFEGRNILKDDIVTFEMAIFF